MSEKPRILTGDTPTGSLHLGHWVGSVKRRVELQDSHDCYFILANMHAFTTRSDKPQEIRRDSIEIVRDYLAMGIDPAKATIFLQSEVPAIAELCFLFAMLLPFNRVMRNPTLKTEIELKGLGETYSFGFPLYAVGQTADILAFRPVGVPVGEDQVPHLELTREVARRFNQMYCSVDEHAKDDEHVALGGVFPVPRADVGKVGRLVGTDGVNKMSKSLGNYIGISEAPRDIFGKAMSIPDETMWDYFELAAGVGEGEVRAMRDALAAGRRHPRDLKEDLAKRLVALYHDATAADREAADFRARFSSREFPEDTADRFESSREETPNLLKLLVGLGAAKSSREAQRLVAQRAVTAFEEPAPCVIGGFPADGDANALARAELPAGAYKLKVGKTRFVVVNLR
jgi:tryptophanyl-tRNA synthetase